jgi:hypothetical protein
MKERRRCQRINHPYTLRARVHSGEPARVLDLSPFGALIETEVALRPGSVCDLALKLETTGLHVRSMIHRCRVSPNESGEGLVFRAGVEFLAPTTALRKPLEDIVARLCLRGFETPSRGGGAAA